MALGAAFLLSGTLAAQQGAQSNREQARDAAFQEAEHYASCWTDVHPNCINSLTDRERLAAAGLAGPDVHSLRSFVRLQRGATKASDFFRWMEVAEPWPPFAIDNALFAFVPFFYTTGVQSVGYREERVGYLIGASHDSGETWRFIQVDGDSDVKSDALDRVIPGYRDGPRPELLDREVQEQPFAESSTAATRERRFVPVDGAFAYSLNLYIRRSFRNPVDFVVRFDNPASRGQTLEFRGSLEPGQRELQWQSPALSSFQSGQTYSVVIEGSDPDTGSQLFEHAEQLLFEPTRENWLSVLAKPPAGQPN